MGGTDQYSNLVMLETDVHELIHATQAKTIAKYLSLLSLGKTELEKVNRFRLLVGNCEIIV